MFKFLKNKTGIVVASLIFAPLVFSTSAFAANSISLNVSSNSVVLDLMPKNSEGTFAKSNNLNISVSMSGVGGYTLGIKSNTTGTNSTKLINTNDNSKYFSSISSAVSESDFSNSSNTSYNDKWGYNPSKYHSIDNTDFQPAPDENGDILDSNNVNNASGNYTISIGARANMNTAVGQYIGTVVITAVANLSCNPNATTIGEAVCMQDMNDNVVNSMGTSTQYQLIDIRDGKQYYIAKMKDGRVWMTQNLDLDLETTPTNVEALTHENTDLGWTVLDANATWIPSAATVTAAADYSSSSTAPASFDYGDRYQYVSTSGVTTSYSTKADCEAAHNDGTCAHYHVGNYYNWTAAIASNDSSSNTTNYTSAPNSICPAGWRLPEGITSTTSTDPGYYHEANYTWVSEGIALNYVFGASAKVSNGENSWINIRNNPLYMVAAGYKSGTSSVTNIGSYGYYWTSTSQDSSRSYMIYFYNNNLYPGINNSKNGGRSVRCVARQSNTGSTIITFDKNAVDATGTTGTNNTQTISANTLTNLTSNGFARTGYAFNSWNTAADGNGDSYADAAQYYAKVGTTTNNVTLYAQWDKLYTITFRTNNATGITFNGTTYSDGQSAQFTAKSYPVYGQYNTRYAFSNWSITAGSFENSSYQNTTYTVVGDATITLTGQYVSTVMQNLSSASCTTTPSPVYDTRDNEVYWIAKLNDNNCWMLDNLRLGSSSSITLTSSNTNIANNYTLPANRSNQFSSAYTTGQIHSGHKNDVVKNYGAGSGKSGVYYNYCAASGGTYCNDASTGGVDVPNTLQDSPYDICPAGWRMPTGYTTGGEYSGLIQSYNSGDEAATALSVSMSGAFCSSIYPCNYPYILDPNSLFQAWSSTINQKPSMNTLQFRGYFSSVTDSMVVRVNGHSIRCIIDD